MIDETTGVATNMATPNMQDPEDVIPEFAPRTNTLYFDIKKGQLVSGKDNPDKGLSAIRLNYLAGRYIGHEAGWDPGNTEYKIKANWYCAVRLKTQDMGEVVINSDTNSSTAFRHLVGALLLCRPGDVLGIATVLANKSSDPNPPTFVNVYRYDFGKGEYIQFPAEARVKFDATEPIDIGAEAIPLLKNHAGILAPTGIRAKKETLTDPVFHANRAPAGGNPDDDDAPAANAPVSYAAFGYRYDMAGLNLTATDGMNFETDKVRSNFLALWENRVRAIDLDRMLALSNRLLREIGVWTSGPDLELPGFDKRHFKCVNHFLRFATDASISALQASVRPPVPAAGGQAEEYDPFADD